MRPLAIVPLLCSLTALILTLLCLFAGSSPSFLPHADLLTLNTSRLGHTSLFNTSDGDGSFISNLINGIEGDINNLINNATSDIAAAFHLHDFYAAHIMNYCEGYFLGNDTPGAQENITHCSNRTAFFHFDPTAIITAELAPGLNLTDLHWPSAITDAAHTIEVASKVMFVFYILAITFSGIALLTSLWPLLSSNNNSSRLPSLTNLLIDLLAFLTIGIASAISTAIIVKAVNAVNKYGADIGLAATKGGTFLGMTWAATAVMLLASAVWVLDGCRGGSSRKGRGEKGGY